MKEHGSCNWWFYPGRGNVKYNVKCDEEDCSLPNLWAMIRPYHLFHCIVLSGEQLEYRRNVTSNNIGTECSSTSSKCVDSAQIQRIWFCHPVIHTSYLPYLWVNKLEQVYSHENLGRPNLHPACFSCLTMRIGVIAYTFKSKSAVAVPYILFSKGKRDTEQTWLCY